MGDLTFLYKFLLSFLWSLIITVFAIPPIINLAHHKRILDIPNGRTVHLSTTPRLGGVAIFAGFFSSCMIFASFTSETAHLQYMLAGSILLFFIGMKDDVSPVSAFKKFFVQVLSSGVVVFLGDVRITSFYGVMGIGELDNGVSYLLTFLIIIGVTNAFNLIDGVNGLAGSLLVFALVLFGIPFYTRQLEMSVVIFALTGALIGFLRYNLFSGKIFMGDTGSLVCGFVVAVLSIDVIELGDEGVSPVYVLSVLFIPVFDTLRVMALRTAKGVSPFTPDQRHLHHLLLSMGLSHKLTVAVLISLNSAIVIGMYSCNKLSSSVQLLVLVTIALIMSVLLQIVSRYEK